MIDNFKNFFQNHPFSEKLKFDTSAINIFYKTFIAGITPTENNNHLIILGGSPGAGKTTYRLTKLSDLKNHFVVDMDNILEKLPGYEEDLKSKGMVKAFALWWQKAQLATDLLVDFAFKSRFNVIYDRTCGTENAFLMLTQAYKDGYNVKFHGFHVDEEKAINRIAHRSKLINRTVNPEQIIEYAARFSALWPLYVKVFDNAILFDTNEGIKIIYSKEPQEEIRDKPRYEAFLEVGKKIDFEKCFPKLSRSNLG